MKDSRKIMMRLLQIACIALFIGRGWQHLASSTPFRVFFWNERLMSPLVRWFTAMQWSEYVTNPRVDEFINTFSVGMGIFYFICAITVLFIHSLPRLYVKTILYLGSFSLFFLAVLLFYDRGFQIGHFIEYAAQFSAPVFLYLFKYSRFSSSKLFFGIKIAVACTFIGHGLYSIGYHPRPGFFVDMTIKGFYVTEPIAHHILFWVGVLDILISIGLFIPVRFIMLVSSVYAVVWGLLTSLARVTTHFYWDFWEKSLLQWIPEMLYRFPHFILPLLIFIHILYSGKLKK